MSTQISEWLNRHSDSERKRLADTARTTVGYLWQLAGGHRKASLDLASRLSAASKGSLTLEGIRPDLAELIKPVRRKKAA